MNNMDNDMSRSIILTFFTFITLPIIAQSVITPREHPDLSKSFWTLSVQDADTGEELVDIRSHHLMTPASTLKLVSTATLISQRPAGDRIPTKIMTDGTITQGVLQGNLYIIGAGDPSIGSRYFWGKDENIFFDTVANALQQKGITHISGSIISLSPASDFQAENPRWPAYDMGNHYAAGIYDLNLFDNAYSVHFTNYGERFYLEPKIPNLVLKKAYDITATRSRDSLYISPFRQPDGSFVITGAYPRNVSNLRIRGSIPNPPLFMAQYLHQRLASRGIQVTGEAETISTLSTTHALTELYTYYSPPLRELVTITNVYSHNLFAEAMLMQLARGKTPLPGHNTTQTAISEVLRYWKDRGMNTQELEMMDGSGLSGENRVTAHFLATMLGKVHRADPSGTFMSTLPRAGQDGTLAIFLKNTPLQGRARLKSGSIRNVVCYAGYVQLNGKTYTVAFMVNNFYGKASTIRQAMEQILLDTFQLK